MTPTTDEQRVAEAIERLASRARPSDDAWHHIQTRIEQDRRQRTRRTRRNRLALVAAAVAFVTGAVLVGRDGGGPGNGPVVTSEGGRQDFGFEGEPDAESLPPGWSRTGQHVDAYEFRSVDDRVYRGQRSARIRFTGQPAPDSFGTIMRCERADDYHGKRVRLSGYLATEAATGNGTGLWLRADGYAREQLGFDNMAKRWLTGDNAYERAEVAIDVPDNTFQLCFGFLLSGPGTAWADELVLEPVADLPPEDGTTGSEPEELRNP